MDSICHVYFNKCSIKKTYVKRQISYGIIIAFLIVISYMVYSIISKKQQIVAQERGIKVMPNFSFKTLENQTYSYEELDSDNYTLIVFFSTTCIYCEYQLEDLLKNYKQLLNTKVLLVSVEKINKIKKYAEKISLNNYKPEIVVLRSSIKNFKEKFGIWSTPTVFLYTPSKQLVFARTGSMQTDSIATYIHE